MFSQLTDWFRNLSGQSTRFQGNLEDVTVRGGGVEFTPDHTLDYYWFQLEENGWQGFRIVRLSELTYIPQEYRATPSLVSKQAALHRGLIATGIELITLSFGIFDPPVGVVQCYGVGTRGATQEGAVMLAREAHAALIANFAAQFPQSRLSALSLERATFLYEARALMPRVTTLIGQPDPREGARGGGQAQGPRVAQFSEQQNELLFRALARAREEFLFMNIATPVRRADIARMQTALGNLASPIASRQQGATSIGFGVSLPLILSMAQGVSAGQAYGASESQGVSDSVGVAKGVSHTEGIAHGSSWARTEGVAHTEGQAHTDSATHTSGASHSVGVSHAEGASQGTAVTDGTSSSHGVANSTGSMQGASQGVALAQGTSHTEGSSVNAGGSLKAEPFGLGVGLNAGVGASQADSVSQVGTESHGASWATSSGTSVSDSTTTSHATSVNNSTSVSDGRSEGWSTMESNSVGNADTRSSSDAVSSSSSVGGSTTRSVSDGVSQSVSAAHGVSRGVGISQGRTLGAMQSMGMGGGVAPSVSVSKSFQWKDENAVALTELLEQQINILKEAAEEGGVYSDVYILTRTENGRRVAEAAAVQAFGGSQGVVTHVLPRRPRGNAEEAHLRRHAQCFNPSPLTESLGWINGYAFSTLITPMQQAAYSAPGLFEEGPALTVQERTPPFAFRPGLPGDVVLGHQFSTERGEMTAAPLALTEARHFHTIFAADTGFGKTVAAERLALEVVKRWHHRAVVLDFGAGWRHLLNAPLPPERVDLYQLYPGARRPFRWNFLQIGRRIAPDAQYLATAHLMCAAGRMGPRQIGFMRRALRAVYIEAGVLLPGAQDTQDEFLQLPNTLWEMVQAGEVAVIERARLESGVTGKPLGSGQRLETLSAFDRQALAVQRSKAVDVVRVYTKLKDHFEKLTERDPTKNTVEGVLLRLEPFTRGDLARMYGSGDGSLAVDDLGLLGPEAEIADRWGLCVLEGGAELDEYAKVVVLSLVAWHLYTDAVIRRRERIGAANRPLNIFWEEANKLLNGVGESEAGTSSSGGAVQLWQAMWRDGRKYKVFLHPLVQTISELPPGILASCNNAFFGQMKHPQDRDLAVSHLARSERGFTDEEYKRYLSRIPQKKAIVKLGYSDDVTDLEPMLAQPLMVPGPEPGDAEIEAFLAGR